MKRIKLFEEFIFEMEFKNKEEYAEYAKNHKIRKDTEITFSEEEKEESGIPSNAIAFIDKELGNVYVKANDKWYKYAKDSGWYEIMPTQSGLESYEKLEQKPATVVAKSLDQSSPGSEEKLSNLIQKASAPAPAKKKKEKKEDNEVKVKEFTCYHTSTIELTSLGSTPMWFTRKKKYAMAYHRNAVEKSGEAFTYEIKIKGRILSLSQAEDFASEAGIDHEEIVADLTANPDAKNILKLAKPYSKICDGFDHWDYDPIDWGDAESTLIFNPNKVATIVNQIK